MPQTHELLPFLVEGKEEEYWYDVWVPKGSLDKVKEALSKANIEVPEPSASGHPGVESRLRYVTKDVAQAALKVIRDAGVRADYAPIWKKRLRFEDIASADMKNAPSYERGGHVAGDAIIEVMQELGLSEDEIRWIFESKHYRWFLDQNEPDIKKFVKRRFKTYVEQNSNHVQGDIRKFRRGENQ